MTHVQSATYWNTAVRATLNPGTDFGDITHLPNYQANSRIPDITIRQSIPTNVASTSPNFSSNALSPAGTVYSPLMGTPRQNLGPYGGSFPRSVPAGNSVRAWEPTRQLKSLTLTDPVKSFQQPNFVSLPDKLSSSGSLLQTSTNMATNARAASGAVQATSGIASVPFGPISLAVQASQAIGGAVAAGYQNSDQNQVSSNYSRNLAIHAPGNNIYAEAQRTSEQVRANYAATGASIGAIFGPIGALAGYYIGKASAPETESYKVDSFSGPNVTPTDNNGNTATE